MRVQINREMFVRAHRLRVLVSRAFVVTSVKHSETSWVFV
jgi:hypothetical protein